MRRTPWPAWIALALGAACTTDAEPGEPAPAEAVSNGEALAGAAPPEKLAPIPEPEPEPPRWEPREEDRVTPHFPLENPEALAPFYDKLAKVDDGDEDLARVVHLGASMIGADDLTSVLRSKFQTRFGDGGAGLVLLWRYMGNYMHRWVKLKAKDWKHCYIAYLCKGDGRYGLGGVTFWSDGGAETKISTRKHELGDEVSRFELWYLAHKRGGRFGVRIDSGEEEIIKTRSDELEDRYHEIDVEQGPHTIRIRAAGSGRARGYGVVLETDGPGVVWDQFSMLGAFTKRLLGWNPEHIAGQIAHRDPDLIAFTYGGNDLRRVATGGLPKEKYVKEYLDVVKLVHAGKPEAACLIIAIFERGKSLVYTIKPKHMDVIVEAQREVAKQAGCGFYDTYAAMGGPGGLKKWRKEKPPLAAGDLKHLTHAGRVKLGGWIYDAIMAGYVAHRTAG